MDASPPEDEGGGPNAFTLILVFLGIIAAGGFLVYKMVQYNELQRCYEERHSNCGEPLPQPDAPGASQ